MKKYVSVLSTVLLIAVLLAPDLVQASVIDRSQVKLEEVPNRKKRFGVSSFRRTRQFGTQTKPIDRRIYGPRSVREGSRPRTRRTVTNVRRQPNTEARSRSTRTLSERNQRRRRYGAENRYNYKQNRRERRTSSRRHRQAIQAQKGNQYIKTKRRRYRLAPIVPRTADEQQTTPESTE